MPEAHCDKGSMAVKMSKKDFKSEHKKLVKVLRSGSRSKREQEAKDQSKELKQKA